jgi:hypothetical protein
MYHVQQFVCFLCFHTHFGEHCYKVLWEYIFGIDIICDFEPRKCCMWMSLNYLKNSLKCKKINNSILVWSFWIYNGNFSGTKIFQKRPKKIFLKFAKN